VSVDVSKVSKHFVDDVELFCSENSAHSSVDGRGPSDLEPEEFFKFYLHWNGIIGYSSEILQLLKELGWRPGPPLEFRALWREKMANVTIDFSGKVGDFATVSAEVERRRTCSSYSRVSIEARVAVNAPWPRPWEIEKKEEES
jgi:hypothetical protein